MVEPTSRDRMCRHIDRCCVSVVAEADECHLTVTRNRGCWLVHRVRSTISAAVHAYEHVSVAASDRTDRLLGRLADVMLHVREDDREMTIVCRDRLHRLIGVYRSRTLPADSQHDAAVILSCERANRFVDLTRSSRLPRLSADGNDEAHVARGCHRAQGIR